MTAAVCLNAGVMVIPGHGVKIVCHNGKLYGRPTFVTDAFKVERVVKSEMARFPWKDRSKEHDRTLIQGSMEFIVRYCPLTRLSERATESTCLFFHRFKHDKKAIEFAKGRIQRTKSLVSRLSKEHVHMIITHILGM